MWKYNTLSPCENIYPGYRFKSNDVEFAQKVWKVDTIGCFSECIYSNKLFLCTADIDCPNGTFLIVRRYRSYELGAWCTECMYRRYKDVETIQ